MQLAIVRNVTHCGGFSRSTSLASIFRMTYWGLLQSAESGFLSIGRSAEIRTRDPLHPMQVRYQTAPRSDREVNYAENRPRSQFPVISAAVS